MPAIPKAIVAALIATTMTAACATTGPEPMVPRAMIAVAGTSPPPGSVIAPNSVLRVMVDYSLEEFRPGRHGIVLVLKTREGGLREASRHILTQDHGRVRFVMSGADLVSDEALVHPLQMHFALDSTLPPHTQRILKTSPVIEFAATRVASEEQKRMVKFLPPSVGSGQIASDVRNDPRYKPRLPEHLNQGGNVVWGLFKVCVDDLGDVFAVRVLRSAHQDVDASWMETIKTWKHQPYAVGGKPVPYCYPMRLEVVSQF